MDLTVTGAEGLPEKAYISIRAGETRKQVQYRPGECFRFESKAPPRQFVVDIFEKVGSAQVNVSDLLSSGEHGGLVQFSGRNGSDIKLDMSVKVKGEKPLSFDSPKKSRHLRHQAALDAQLYLENHSVHKVLQGMVHELLASRPPDPFEFMKTYIQDFGASGNLSSTMPVPATILPKQMEELNEDDDFELPNWSGQPGLGAAEYPGFAGDGSEPLPDLSDNHSVVAQLLSEDRTLYERLKDVRSSSGLCLAHCIKPGVDIKGHGIIKTVGLVAGDDSCYDVFSEVFIPVLERWTASISRSCPFAPAELEQEQVFAEALDPSGKHIVSMQVHCSRNISDIRMPSAARVEELAEAERMLTSAMLTLEDSRLRGDYHPLRGSTTYAAKPTGMSVETESRLRAENLLFCEPESVVQLSSGFGRNWPQARGVYVSQDKCFFAEINEADHLRLTCRLSGQDLWQAFGRLQAAESTVSALLQEMGRGFAKSDCLGFVTSCPSIGGSGVQASAVLCLPLLSREENFKTFVRNLGLTLCRKRCNEEDVVLWEVFAARNHTWSGTAVVGSLARACRHLIEMELNLKAGKHVDLNAASFPDSRATTAAVWNGLQDLDSRLNFPLSTSQQLISDALHPEDDVLPGLGDDEFPGFPVDKCPDEIPDLSRCHSLMATVLKDDPTIYAELKDVYTSSGVSLARCIKTGVDNLGHPLFRTIGAVAGDAECYDAFRKLFDGIISRRLSSVSLDYITQQPFALAPDEVVGQPLSTDGSHIVSVEVRAQRNLHGFRFTPAMLLSERKEVERHLTTAFNQLEGELAGEYLPLWGSETHASRPGNVTEAELEELESAQLLFQEPDADIVLATGSGKNWPQARGIFLNSSRNLVAWVNNDDHLRIISVRQDGDLKAAFATFCSAHEALSSQLAQTGICFSRHERLGFLTSCPTNVGTALRAAVRLRLPHLSGESGLRKFAMALKLQVTRVSHASELLWEASNLSQLGTSEVEQVQQVLDGVARLLEVERRLQNGEAVDLSLETNSILNGFSTKVLRKAADVGVSLRYSDTPGLGEDEVPGFPTDACPEELPNLKGYRSVIAELLQKDPAIYERLRNWKTQRDVTFAKCIKPGMDNKGHPMIRTVGIVAGDAECYDVFREAFVTAAIARHPGYDALADGAKHPSALDPSQVVGELIDPFGKYVVSVRIKVSRDLADFRFPSAVSRDERRQIEDLATKMLSKLGQDLTGEYLPLRSSSSYAPRVEGMTVEEAEALESQGLLFREPDSRLVLSSGMGRHWPEARGVFATPSKDFAVWVNEEDHFRLVVTQPGDCLQQAFARLCAAESSLHEELKQEGFEFARSEALGFLTSCPSKLGSGGLQASVILRLPLLSSMPDFKAKSRALSVTIRALQTDAWGSVWKVSAAAKLGQGEADLINHVAAACRKLVEEEATLAQA